MTTLVTSAPAVTAPVAQSTIREVRIHVMKDWTRKRARVRRVCLMSLVRDTCESLANKNKNTLIKVEHGGSVANKYGYPARTDSGLAVAITAEDGSVDVLVWGSAVPANKVTCRGAAASCLGIAGCVFDGRVSRENKDAAIAGVISYCRDLIAADNLSAKADSKLYIANHGGQKAIGTNPDEAISKCCEKYAAVLAR